MSKDRIFLIHWNKAEVEAYAKTLRDWGWDVDFEYEDGARGGNAIKLNPPAAVVIYHTVFLPMAALPPSILPRLNRPAPSRSSSWAAKAKRS